MKTRLSWLLVAVSILALLAGGIWWARGDGSYAEPLPDELSIGPPLSEFTLTTQDGDDFHSSSLDGQIWVASYFFTRCASNCRELNTRLSRLQREYGPQGVRFVSISCDPSFDGPEQLTRYANLMSADHRYWTFLTGNFTYVQRIGHHVIGQPVTEREHNAMITIFDRDGESHGVFYALDPNELDRAVRLIEALIAVKADRGVEIITPEKL